MELIREITIPDEKELFIVGDIHGCFDLYTKGVKALGITDDDVVISLGDLTDRGKQNFRCVVEFTRKENRYAIRGNHEDMFIRGMLDGDARYYHCWQMNGGHTVWDEVGEEGCTLLATMLEELPVVLVVKHRGKTFGFVHGGVPSVYEFNDITDIANWHTGSARYVASKVERTAEHLMWDRDMVECAKEGIQLPKVVGVDLVFHGHSYVKEPIINANRVYMDTGSVFNGNITFAYFDKEENLCFYSTLEED